MMTMKELIKMIVSIFLQVLGAFTLIIIIMSNLFGW